MVRHLRRDSNECNVFAVEFAKVALQGFQFEFVRDQFSTERPLKILV
jgi:hypothetical protein